MCSCTVSSAAHPMFTFKPNILNKLSSTLILLSTALSYLLAQSFDAFQDILRDDYTLITSKFGVIITFYLLLLCAFNFNANS